VKRETLLLPSISNRASDETSTLLQPSRGCGVVEPMKGRLDGMLGMGLREAQPRFVVVVSRAQSLVDCRDEKLLH
jgi:hypothetical protein